MRILWGDGKISWSGRRLGTSGGGSSTPRNPSNDGALVWTCNQKQRLRHCYTCWQSAFTDCKEMSIFLQHPVIVTSVKSRWIFVLFFNFFLSFMVGISIKHTTRKVVYLFLLFFCFWSFWQTIPRITSQLFLKLTKWMLCKIIFAIFYLVSSFIYMYLLMENKSIDLVCCYARVSSVHIY